MRTQMFKVGLLASAVSLLAACGGESDSGFASVAAVEVGVLADAPISGASYVASPSNLRGTTNAHGEYNYRPGDTVTFTIGGVALPAVPATGRVTPSSIAAHMYAGNDVNIANATINLAILFQSLDDNGNPDDGIQIDEEAELTGFTPASVLLQAPAAFVTTLDAALPEDFESVSVADAIEHYYSSELMGSWKAISVKETRVEGEGTPSIENFTMSDDLGFLFSFDRDGQFVYSTWDTTSATDENRHGDVAVGQVRYPDEGTEVTLTGIERSLANGSMQSSTDPNEPLIHPEFTTTVVLQGDKVIITNTWEDDEDGDEVMEDVTSVFTLERLQNQKDGLKGLWVENNYGRALRKMGGNNGAVSFGEGVANVFTYYLSDSLLAFVVTNNDPEDEEDSPNGVFVANYTRNGDTITLGAIKHDGVSSGEPVFSAGDTFTHGPVSADGRSMDYDYGDEDSGQLTRVLSSADVNTFFDVTNFTGYWVITEITGANTCGDEVGESYSTQYFFGQEGASLFVSTWSEEGFEGVVNGRALSWQGSIVEEGGTYTQSTTATVSANGNSISGSSSFNWNSNSTSNCSGTITFTGVRSNDWLD